MSRETAFKIVIDYLLKIELESNAFDYVLSNDYSFAGIAISAGKVGSGNAWFVAICLRSAELVSEIQMLNLINQLRADPEKISNYTNPGEDYENDPIITELIDGEYKPLFFDASLSASAQAHSIYKLNGVYPEEDLSETQTALERAEYYGYEGEVVQEHDLRKPYFSTEKNDRSVYKFFLSWIEKELKGVSPPCSAVVFSTGFQDVGSNITFQSGDNDYDISALSFVVGKKAPNTGNDESSSSDNDEKSRIYGVLFSDKDGDDLYDPGEEEKCIQQTVTVYDVETQEIETVVTDNAGHFFISLKTNRQYSFTATIEDVPVTWYEDGLPITSDQFVKLRYPPPSLENNLLTVDLQ
jgi:hypothetical protein